MMRKRTYFLLVLLLFSAAVAPVGAQSNVFIDRFLEEKQATVGDAAFLILAASNLVAEDATADRVMAAVSERSLLPAARGAQDPITLGEVSFLIMKTLGLNGGLMYMAFPGPRYAARELAHLGFIPGNTHPGRTISGQEVMHILGEALQAKGERQ
jgi:hypothetical protein